MATVGIKGLIQLNRGLLITRSVVKGLITSKNSMYSATMYSDFGLFSQYLTYMYRRRSYNVNVQRHQINTRILTTGALCRQHPAHPSAFRNPNLIKDTTRTQILAIRYFSGPQNTSKLLLWPGIHHGPCWESLQRFADPLAGYKGAASRQEIERKEGKEGTGDEAR